MSLEIMRDPRVRSVEWKDLLSLNTWEVVKELLLVFPWLLTSLVLAYVGWYLPALGFSFIFFLCGLRVVHNAYHYAMGIPRLATEWVMFVLSVLMLSAMHALQQTHLHHHKHCMDEEDVEAESARMSGFRARSASETPARVPPEPMALMKASTLPPVWAQISGPVPSTWACLLATLSNWLAQTAPFGSFASSSAARRPEYFT